jgi:hypothetical protein
VSKDKISTLKQIDVDGLSLFNDDKEEGGEGWPEP